MSMLRTAAAALVLAAPLSAAEAIDTSEFHGVRVVDDQSLIELGLNADVQLVRTGAANLSVVVDDLHIHGDVHTDGLFVDGVDIHDICDCDSAASPSGSPAPGDAADGPVDVTVEILTGTTLYSDTVASTFIEFYIPGMEWTPVYRFHRGGIAKGEKVATDYVLPAEPTKLRLSLDGDTDYWGLSQIDVTIAGGDELAILCTDVIGVNPAAGATGHWLSTDATTAPAQELVFDIEPVCKAFVSVTAVTGWNTGSATAGTVYASFKVNGTWTDPTFFFKGSSEGDAEVQHFGLLDEPTAIAFSVSTTDAWGFDSLTAIINGETHVLACEGTHPSLIDGGHDHFVDSNNADLPELLVLEIGHDECDLVNVTLNFRAGDTALSGAADLMHVRFKLPTTGNWTDYYTLYNSINLGGTVEMDFRLEEVPSQLEFFTDGSDKVGIGHVTFSAEGSDPISVVCNHLINRPPSDYSVNWLGGSANSEGLPDSMLVDLTRPACVEVHLDVDTGFVTFSDTDDTVLVEWLVNGSWTQASTFFTSSNVGEREEDDYGLLEEPEAVAFYTAGNDAWGHDYVAVTVHGETTVVVCEGVQTAANPDPFNRYWIDANGEVAPTRTELNVTVADDCDALQTVVLDLHAGDPSNAGTDDSLYVQFEDLAAAGGFGPQYWFFSSIGRNGELTRTFKLRSDVAPTKLNLIMTGTDNFGIGTLTATVNDGPDVVVVCSDLLNDIPSSGDNGYWVDGDNTDAIPDEKELSLLPGDAMCSHIATVLITTGGTGTSGTDDNLYVDFKVDGSFVGQEIFFTSASANSVKSQTYGLQGEPSELKLTMTGTNAYHYDAVQVILNGTQVDLLCAGSVVESASFSATTWIDGNANDAPDTQLFDFVDIDCDATTAGPVGTTVEAVAAN